MTYKGIVRGKIIQLEENLPYPEVQPISVSIARGQACKLTLADTMHDA